MLAGILRGVITRKFNSEYPLIFAACVLRKNRGTFKAAKIKQRITQRLDLWEEGKEEALVAHIEADALGCTRRVRGTIGGSNGEDVYHHRS